jgi:Tfp pilus assembly PilM family ATPase
VQCGVLGVDSLALSDAAEACDFLRVGETVAIVNIGLGAACVHFIKDGVSNFIREVNWGAREMIQAIAKDRRCSYEDAVRQLEEYQYTAPPLPVAMDAEDIPMAQEMPGAAPMRGPAASSLLDPLDDEAFDMAGSQPAGRRPAERGMGADPFTPQAAVQLRDLADVLAPSLTRMATEFRRSFDFYEHQLYEQPVTRIILSGGVATMGLVREALQYELGVDDIESARPDESALLFGDDESVRDLLEQPAQFMVAIGLAARGMADISG